MKLFVFSKGFNYSEDGPGNRLVYHLLGCNMYCPWCSNPEGLQLTKNGGVASKGIIDEIISAKMMFFDGGGVTFTGGECSLQSETLAYIISEIKGEKVSVAIESNAATKNFLKVAKLADYVILDFKHPNGEVLKSVTGGDIAIIKKNIFSITKEKPVHIRIPLIHGFNDTTAALEGFTEFFTTLKNTGAEFDIELLPYHEYGKEKWMNTFKKYSVKDGFVNRETVSKFANCFKNNNFKLIKT